MMRRKWKKISPRGSKPVDCSKRLSKMRVYGVFMPSYGGIEWLSNRRPPSFRKVGKWEFLMSAAPPIGSKMKLCRHTTWSCKHGACLNLNIGPIALNHVPTHLEFLLFPSFVQFQFFQLSFIPRNFHLSHSSQVSQ